MSQSSKYYSFLYTKYNNKLESFSGLKIELLIGIVMKQCSIRYNLIILTTGHTLLVLQANTNDETNKQ